LHSIKYKIFSTNINNKKKKIIKGYIKKYSKKLYIFKNLLRSKAFYLIL
jgi:hypothetical protein